MSRCHTPSASRGSTAASSRGSLSLSHSRSSFRCHPDDERDADEEWHLEHQAERQVVALLHNVDSALYSGAMDASPSPLASPQASPTNSDGSAATDAATAALDAAGTMPALALPVRFPHRKPLLSYMDECAQWNGAFPHFRVDGVAMECKDDDAAAAPVPPRSGRTSRRLSRMRTADLAHHYSQPLFADGTAAAAATATAVEAAAASSAAAVATPADASSLSVQGVRSVIVPAAPGAEASEEELLALDGAGCEEVFAQCSDPALPPSALAHVSGLTEWGLARSRRAMEARGAPPFTPRRARQWESDEARAEQRWNQTILPRFVEPILRRVVPILARAKRRHLQRQQQQQQQEREQAALAARPAAIQLPEPDEEEEEEVLFFDGAQSMPNPWSSSGTGAAPSGGARAPPRSPRTLRLFQLLHLDPQGEWAPPRLGRGGDAEGDGCGGEGEAPDDANDGEGDFIRISMRPHSCRGGDGDGGGGVPLPLSLLHPFLDSDSDSDWAPPLTTKTHTDGARKIATATGEKGAAARASKKPAAVRNGKAPAAATASSKHTAAATGSTRPVMLSATARGRKSVATGVSAAAAGAPPRPPLPQSAAPTRARARVAPPATAATPKAKALLSQQPVQPPAVAQPSQPTSRVRSAPAGTPKSAKQLAPQQTSKPVGAPSPAPAPAAVRGKQSSKKTKV